jgi:hypothetical protein
MKHLRVCLSLLLVLGLAVSASAATNWYRLRAEPDARPAGRALLQAAKLLCANFSIVDEHRRAMIQQRESASDYTPVAENYGFVDVATGQTISEPVAEAAFLEIDSMFAGARPEVEQLCARLAQQ